MHIWFQDTPEGVDGSSNEAFQAGSFQERLEFLEACRDGIHELIRLTKEHERKQGSIVPYGPDEIIPSSTPEGMS